MKIAFLTSQWPDARMGGIGTYTLSCATAMAQAGHDVHVFTFTLPDDARKQLHAGIHFHEVSNIAARVASGSLDGQRATVLYAGGEAVYRLACGALLCAEAMREGVDILEAPEYEALSLPLLLESPPSTAIITQLHSGSAISRMGNAIPTDDEQRIFDAMEFASIALADAVCAPSEMVVKQTRKFFSFEQETQIIPLPVWGTGQSFAPPPIDGPILYVGRLERNKGIAVLTEALNQVLPLQPKMKAKIVGPDTATAPGGRSMRQWVEENLRPDIRNRVELTGPVSQQQVMRDMDQCSFVVVPSFHDTFPLVCAQAMSAGRTAIVSSDTGTVEVIGNAGRIFARGSAEALAEQIIKLSLDRNQLLSLSQQAFERAAAEFDPQSIARRRAALYEHALARVKQQTRPPVGERLSVLPVEYGSALFAPLTRLARAACDLGGAQTPGQRLARVIEKDVLPTASGRADVLLYGAGKHTTRLLGERSVWESRGYHVVGLIDDHPRFYPSGTFMNLPVMSTGSALVRIRHGEPIPPIVLSSDSVEDLLWDKTRELRENGAKVLRLYGGGA